MIETVNACLQGAANAFVIVVAVLWLRDRARMRAAHAAQLAALERAHAEQMERGTAFPPGGPWTGVQ